MNDYNFGNFICMLRENKGMTQQDIADMLGVTPAAVSKWENGSSKPRVEVLFRLAEILDVKPEELMAGRFLGVETISVEAAKRINERYEYLSKIESYASTRVKLKRLISSVIDLSIAVVFTWIATFLVYKIATIAGTDSGTEAIACILCFLLSFLLFFGFRDFVGFGRSLGKRIMRLIVLDKKTGNEANRKQKFLRNITTAAVAFVTSICLVIDVIMMLVRGQSIGDSVANTVVVEKASKKTDNHAKGHNEGKARITEENINIDFQEINAYESSSGLSKRFVVVLVSVIAAITITVIGLLAFYFIKYDSDEIVNTDITKYEEDRAEYCKASMFMPELETLNDNTEFFYSHKTMVYSQFMGFASEGLALFVQYDAIGYENKKTELLNTYTFLDAPVKSNEVYELPVTEFFYKNYHMRVIPDEEYIDFCACKSFALIGFDDENKRIVYCYHYSFDLDYIAEEDEDLEAEMCEFMNEVFEWKNDDLHQ
jgi:transcriptional regulator with XRE-family HTH domain